MKNKKKIIIIISVVLILLGVISFFGYKFYQSIVKDREELNKQVNEILDNYNIFKDNIKNINIKREEIYNSIFKDNYYMEMSNKQDDWMKLLDDYEKEVEKLDNDSNNLKENCENVNFINKDVEVSCDSFSSNYEIIINSFVQDIELYNQNIDSYNEWVDNNKDKKYNKMDKYISDKYTNYIDYNNDGIYLGKE